MSAFGPPPGPRKPAHLLALVLDGKAPMPESVKKCAAPVPSAKPADDKIAGAASQLHSGLSINQHIRRGNDDVLVIAPAASKSGSFP